MLSLLHHRLRELSLRRRHRAAMRKVRVIQSMGLPEDVKQAAIARVMQEFECALDRYVRHG